MTAQGVNKNVLDSLAVGSMIAVHSAPALSGAEVDPVCRAVARPAIKGTIYQGFKKQRSVSVECIPVLGQPACRQGQDLAGKSFDIYPGQDKKPALIYDELKIAFPFVGAPSDPGIARRHRPGRTGKLQAGQIAARQLLGLDEIAQVSPEGDAIAQIMISVDVLFKQGVESPVRSLDKVKGQGIEIAGATRHRILSVALRCADNISRTGRCCGAKAWQDQKALTPEMFEESTALFVLELPCGPFPLEKFADGFGQFGQTEVREIADNLTDEIELGSPKITAGKANLRLKHDCPPFLLFLPYPKAKRMSRK